MNEAKSTPNSSSSHDSASDMLEHDRELKAHIYQQLVDLQPYLAPESQIAVLVQEDDEENEEHVLTLVATLGDFRLESEGRDHDIYEAFGLAKRRMIEKLEDWYSTVVEASDREEQIQSVIEKRHILH